MSVYLLIETQSVSEGSGVHGFLETASYLSQDGHRVNLFLIQNGVFLGIRGGHPAIEALAGAGNVSVWADEFSLRMRTIDAGELTRGIRIKGMETLVDILMSPGCKPVWH
jgi:predicted peroxiredoxin